MNGNATGESIPADSGSEKLLRKHEEAQQRAPQGRHKKDCTCGRCGSGKPKDGGNPPKKTGGAPTSTSPALPPEKSLSEVMGSGAALFFNAHAVLLDDSDWNISPEVKHELGNILSWMLIDDFYKMGGIGKYVVGGILCLGIYAGKASSTAATRKRKEAARKLALLGNGKPSAASLPSEVIPILNTPPADLPEIPPAKGKLNADQVAGPMGRLLSTASPEPK